MLRLAVLLPLVFGAAASAQPDAPDDLAEAVATYADLIVAGDGEATGAFWDPEAYAERVLAGIELSQADVAGVRLGARRLTLGEEFIQADAAGSFRLLRLAERGGEPRARFRMVDAEGGVKYLDLLFQPDEDGAYRLVDAYDFMQAEDLSDSARRILRGLTGSMVQGSGQATGRDRLVVELTQALQREDWQTVVDLYPRIPPREEDRKTLLIFYLQAASMVDFGQYRKALDLFERDFRDDPDAALVLIDHHVLQGDTEAALASIDLLDAGVGGDPFLDYVRANVLLGAGRTNEASGAADRLAEALPDMARAHYPRLDIALAVGDYATLVEGLLHLERDFDHWFDPVMLKNDPAWAGFVASPAFKRWLTARAE